MHELEPLIAGLAAHRPRRLAVRRRLQRAAVAVVLRETRQGIQVLLVKRARRIGDPWSGDIALPGGRLDAVDAGRASRAAQRETLEETGLCIGRDAGIGRLSDRVTLDHRGRAPMIVSPFVYRAAGDTVCRLDPGEVSDRYWVSLAWLDEPLNREFMRWRLGPLALRVPCYRWVGAPRLWGLTLCVLDELRAAAPR